VVTSASSSKQYRIAGEIDAAFDQIRAAGGKVSHGKVSFDLWSRTVGVADIATESAVQPAVAVKIANLTVLGASQPAPERFSADRIEAADVEIAARTPSPAHWQVSYKAPRIVIKNYSGPANLPQPPASASAIEMYRFILERFATISASSVEAPSIAGTMNMAPAMAANFTYSGFALRDIKNGKIATMQVERANFTSNMQQAGKSNKVTGDIANIVSHDFDAAAAAAMFDPQKANDDRYYRVYGQTTAGPYTVNSDQGVQMRIDRMTIDDVAMRPSGLQLPALLATIPAAGTPPPTPEQARALIDKIARIYGSIRIGEAEMSGLSIGTPQGPFKLAAIRFNLQDGKVDEFAMEGLYAHSPKGPFAVGRFALKSLDIANLLHVSAQYQAQKPMPDQLLGLLALLQGVEVKGVVAPFMDTGKSVNLDNFSLNWGEFAGSIPSRARLTVKMTTPVDARNPSTAALIGAGIDTISTDDEIGAAWTEASGAFVLDPVKIQIGGIMEASARVSLGHVQRQVFSFNPQQATAMAAQIEAGTIEITVHDIGGVDLGIKQYARTQNLSADAARQAIVAAIRTTSTGVTVAIPDAAIIVDALVGFIEKPGTTLTLKLTPRGDVPAMLLIQQAKADPLGALAQFQVEAATRQ
jgi:hypothetical protein